MGTQVLRPLVVFAALLLPAALAPPGLRNPGAVLEIELDASGSLLVASSVGGAYVWDLASLSYSGRVLAEDFQTRHIRFAGPGLFSVRRDCHRANETAVLFWEGANQAGRRIGSFPGAIAAAAMSPNLLTLLIVGRDGMLVEWDLGDQVALRRQRLAGFDQPVRRLVPIDFSPDRRFLALRDWNSYYLHIVHTSDGTLLHRSEYYAPEGSRPFAFDPRSSRYFDGVRVRSTFDGQVLQTIRPRATGRLERAAFSPDGAWLALLLQKADDEQCALEFHALTDLNETGSDRGPTPTGDRRPPVTRILPAPASQTLSPDQSEEPRLDRTFSGRGTALAWHPRDPFIFVGFFDGNIVRVSSP
ncbi:MAG: WD40 repeat domain-containing protein [Leptospiraceae bacterium]|nr:WD40 repeat domain-containing protein [Leptospiraceae bacterium]MCP5484132.1 WD40 repeat domain-containing protein [Spirochaetales bacterium]